MLLFSKDVLKMIYYKNIYFQINELSNHQEILKKNVPWFAQKYSFQHWL